MKDIYWMINTRGMAVPAIKCGKYYKIRKEFGNCFRTEKKAKIALKRIKAVFKRIK